MRKSGKTKGNGKTTNPEQKMPETRASSGSGPVLNEMKRKEILAIISVGCNRTTAAHYAGCRVADIREEAKRNRRFAGELLRAEEQSEIFFLEKIRKAANKEQYWRAAAWALERRYPGRYASRGAGALTVEQVHEIVDRLAEIVVEELPGDNDRRRLLSRIRGLIQEAAESPGGDAAEDMDFSTKTNDAEMSATEAEENDEEEA